MEVLEEKSGEGVFTVAAVSQRQAKSLVDVMKLADAGIHVEPINDNMYYPAAVAAAMAAPPSWLLARLCTIQVSLAHEADQPQPFLPSGFRPGLKHHHLHHLSHLPSPRITSRTIRISRDVRAQVTLESTYQHGLGGDEEQERHVELDVQFDLNLWPFYPPKVRPVWPKLHPSSLGQLVTMDELCLHKWNPLTNVVDLTQQVA